MTYPEQASSTPQVVSDNKTAEEGQSPSPVVDDPIAMARDEEDRVSSVTPPALPVVSDNEMAEEGENPSPVIAGPIVIAHDKEDGASYAQRLVAAFGPTERGEGTVWRLRLSSQPPFTPLEPQGPGSPNPIPCDAATHIPFLLASELAQYYSQTLGLEPTHHQTTKQSSS